MAQSPQDGPFFLGLSRLIKQLLLEDPNVVSLSNKLSSFFRFHKLAEKVNGGLDDLVFLRRDHDFKYDLLEERLQPISLHWLTPDRRGSRQFVDFLSKLSVVFAKVEVDSVPYHLELIDSKLIVILNILRRLNDISANPIRLYRDLALPIDILAAQLEASADVIQTLHRELRQLRVRPNNIAHNLH